MARPKNPIRTREQQAIELAAAGKSYQEIGDELGVDRTTVSRWFRREDVRAMRDAALAEVVRAMVPRAYAVLHKQLDDKNPWVAQGAAREVIRLYDQQQGAADQSVVVSFANMPTPGTPQGAGDLPGGKENKEIIETEYA